MSSRFTAVTEIDPSPDVNAIVPGTVGRVEFGAAASVELTVAEPL